MTRFSTFFPRISETFFCCIGIVSYVSGAYRSVVKVYWYNSLDFYIFYQIYNHCSPRDLFYSRLLVRWSLIFYPFFIYINRARFKDKLYQVIFVRNIFSTMIINTIVCDLAPRVPWASARILPFSEGVVQKRLCRATCRLDNWPERVRIDVTGVDNRHGTGF